MTIYPCPKPQSLPKPPKGMRKRNKARAGEEFKRTYGSKARQKWVNMQPCSACGVWGYSQNAHVMGNDGAKRKGHYTTIAPLCGPRQEGTGVYRGCHQTSDEHQDEFRARFPSYSPKKASRDTQKRWQSFLRSSETTAE